MVDAIYGVAEYQDQSRLLWARRQSGYSDGASAKQPRDQGDDEKPPYRLPPPSASTQWKRMLLHEQGSSSLKICPSVSVLSGSDMPDLGAGCGAKLRGPLMRL
jgi:hypothetical protein